MKHVAYHRLAASGLIKPAGLGLVMAISPIQGLPFRALCVSYVQVKQLQRLMLIRADRLALVFGGALVVISTVVAFTETASGSAVTTNAPAAPIFRQPTSLPELLALPVGELDKVDVGLINILCAEGLPGSEDLQVQKCLDLLDAWAQRVKIETQRHFYRFAEHPELFCHSLAYYQMQMLGDVLVNGLRMRYDPKRVEQSLKGLDSREAEAAFFTDSKDIFLFGLLDGDRYGTCASMPFLYVAIARRLGYPVNLVATQEHLYVRCEDINGEHLNVEATAVSRFKTPPDEYYRDMVTARDRGAEIAGGGWLRPLSNQEIVGHSLLSRLACLRSAGRNDEALKTWDIAAKFLPDTPRWRESINERKREAAGNRDTARWTALWREIERAPVPRGAGFVYFRDQKIRLHLLMMGGADLGAVRKAVDDFNSELGKSLKQAIEKDGPGVIALPPPDQSQPTYTAHFRFSDSGKEIVIPEDLMPPTARGGVSQPLLDAIAAHKLESKDAILDFLWDRYEEANLRQQRAEKARMDALVQNGPQPILIARESVPPEYWNGMPQNLELTLEGETDPKRIVGIITSYYSAQEAKKRNRESMAVLRPASLMAQTPFGSPAASDYFGQQGLMQAQAEAVATEMMRPKVLPFQSRIRFVPASTIPGNPFLFAPGTPGFPSAPVSQQMPQTPNY